MAENKTLDGMVEYILGDLPQKSAAPSPAKQRKILAPETRAAIAAAVIDDGRKGIDVAKEYGISPATVSNIVAAAKCERNNAASPDKAVGGSLPKDSLDMSEISVAIHDAYSSVERLVMISERMSGQSRELLAELKRIWGDNI